MSIQFDIRDTNAADLAQLQVLYADAFPDEDLWPVVSALLGGTEDVVSLGACVGGTVVGHALVTMCGLEGQGARVGLLGPLGVRSAYQRQGIGRALIEESVARLAAKGGRQLQVLGDPQYYGRLGFVASRDVMPPYALPPEWRDAWQVRTLQGDTTALHGRLRVPPPWREPALWGS